MSCGYACVGCGRCRGKPRELNISSVCFRCGHDNPEGASRCEECGLELPRPVSALSAAMGAVTAAERGATDATKRSENGS